MCDSSWTIHVCPIWFALLSRITKSQNLKYSDERRPKKEDDDLLALCHGQFFRLWNVADRCCTVYIRLLFVFVGHIRCPYTRCWFSKNTNPDIWGRLLESGFTYCAHYVYITLLISFGWDSQKGRDYLGCIWAISENDLAPRALIYFLEATYKTPNMSYSAGWLNLWYYRSSMPGKDFIFTGGCARWQCAQATFLNTRWVFLLLPKLLELWMVLNTLMLLHQIHKAAWNSQEDLNSQQRLVNTIFQPRVNTSTGCRLTTKGQ